MTESAHAKHMRQALWLARTHMEAGEGGPFGAVVVFDGAVVAEGWNQVTSTNDPTAHAEIIAIRRACAALDCFTLAGSVLYTSCEPCPMCLTAAYWARIDRIFFAGTREDAAAADFDDAYLYDEVALSPDRRALPMRSLLTEEAREVFQAWVRKSDKIGY